MAVNLPESLVNLPSNCGIFALWMLFQHHGIDKDIYELAEACQHDEEEGTFTIALAVALRKMGFDVTFHSAPDPNIDARERFIYTQAERLKVAIQSELSYQGIIEATKQGKFVIVFYDTLDGIGHQSLVHSIDENEICFFDNFSSMSAKIFEQQRNAEGICQQVIIVDDQQFNTLSTKMN